MNEAKARGHGQKEQQEQEENRQNVRDEQDMHDEGEDVVCDDDDSDDNDEIESADTSRGTKRSQYNAVSDSFRKTFPPLKTRRPTYAPSSIKITNPYSMLDLDSEDPPLKIDESNLSTLCWVGQVTVYVSPRISNDPLCIFLSS
jgi:hypothetical protein